MIKYWRGIIEENDVFLTRNCDRCCSRPADDDKVLDVDATEDVNQDLESRLPADSLLPMGDEANEQENICND